MKARRVFRLDDRVFRSLIAFLGALQTFHRWAAAPPTMIGHNTHAQASCDIALKPSFRCHLIRLSELRNDFRSRMPSSFHHGLSPAAPALLPPIASFWPHVSPPDSSGQSSCQKRLIPPVPTDRSLSIVIPKLLNEAEATSKQKVHRFDPHLANPA